MTDRLAYSAAELAKALGVSRTTIYRKLAPVPFTDVLGDRRYLREDVELFLRLGLQRGDKGRKKRT